MHHADRPYQARRLAGVDQALGEGRAREPADLLNQLRERLDSLAANHPSAQPDRSQPAEPDEQPEGDAVEPAAETGSGDTDSRPRRDEPHGKERRERSHAPEQGGPGQSGPGQASPEQSSTEQGATGHGDTQDFTKPFGEAPAGSGASLPQESAPEGRYAQFDPVRTNMGEPYRPWFAADEPGEPWFVE